MERFSINLQRLNGLNGIDRRRSTQKNNVCSLEWPPRIGHGIANKNLSLVSSCDEIYEWLSLVRARPCFPRTSLLSICPPSVFPPRKYLLPACLLVSRISSNTRRREFFGGESRRNKACKISSSHACDAFIISTRN